MIILFGHRETSFTLAGPSNYGNGGGGRAKGPYQGGIVVPSWGRDDIILGEMTIPYLSTRCLSVTVLNFFTLLCNFLRLKFRSDDPRVMAILVRIRSILFRSIFSWLSVIIMRAKNCIGVDRSLSLQDVFLGRDVCSFVLQGRLFTYR